MSRLVLCVLALLLVVSSLAPVRADDAEDNAVAVIEKMKCTVKRDENKPGKPVTGVKLSGMDVTDGLKVLHALKNLTELEVVCLRLNEPGLKELASNKNLTKLFVSSAGLTDAGLKELAAVKSLTSLELLGLTISDKGVKELTALPKLATLGLFSTNVTGDGLKELAVLKNLTAL